MQLGSNLNRRQFISQKNLYCPNSLTTFILHVVQFFENIFRYCSTKNYLIKRCAEKIRSKSRKKYETRMLFFGKIGLNEKQKHLKKNFEKKHS